MFTNVSVRGANPIPTCGNSRIASARIAAGDGAGVAAAGHHTDSTRHEPSGFCTNVANAATTRPLYGPSGAMQAFCVIPHDAESHNSESR